RSNWTFFNDSADALAGGSGASGDALGVQDGDDSAPNWRRPLALSITGGLLILGLQLAASGPKPPWAAREARITPQVPVRSAAAMVDRPTTGTVSYASVSNQWSDVESSASVGTQWSDVESYAPVDLQPAE